jgi:hypothetical protein
VLASRLVSPLLPGDFPFNSLPGMLQYVPMVFTGGFLLLCFEAGAPLLVYPVPWPLFMVAESPLVLVWTLLGFPLAMRFCQYRQSLVAAACFLLVVLMT